MAKDEFDRYLCAGGRGGGEVEAVIFSFDKSTSLEGGQKKKSWDDQGGFQKMKGKSKEIIITHPRDKLWMLPKSKAVATRGFQEFVKGGGCFDLSVVVMNDW